MTVTLIDYMGDDLRIVNAARVSYDKRSEWQIPDLNKPDGKPSLVLKPADVGLIEYLMRERHGTPFEMVTFQFHVECSIGVAREWQRHRIGSFNEVSTRYVEMGNSFYVPGGAQVRCQIGKPGHYTMIPMAEDDSAAISTYMQETYEYVAMRYRHLLASGLAKEVARNVLPLGTMTQFYWQVNLRSLFNFLSLRTAPSALLEIREEALQVESLIYVIVPVALAAWNKHGRVAV